MKYVGAIAFLDSVTHENRLTTVMGFEVAAEWRRAVIEYFEQEVLAGNYDGTEVLVNVYGYKGERAEFEKPEDDFVYDTDNLVTSIGIRNPYWVY